MNDHSKDFLEKLLNTPGVSGYEQPVQAVVREYAEGIADRVSTDVHGNVIATINEGSSPHLMLEGHCDQLGMLVSHIDDGGFLYFQTVGGWDAQQLVGHRVHVWTAGGPVSGVISRKAVHLLSDSEKKSVVDPKEMWIDIGAKDRDEAESAVAIADAVTVHLGMEELWNGLATAPAMDNRSGVWVVFEAMRRAKERGFTCALTVASTVQEEIGLRGARTATYGIAPDLAVAVDVTHATDCPSIDKRQRGRIGVGDGPVILRGPNINPRVGDLLRAAAEDAGVGYQVAALGRAAPNDANAIQISGAGVATGLVQIPNRYMHSAVEVVSLHDLDATATLLATLASNLEAGVDLIP